MGKFEKVLIATDFDGTLVTDKGEILPEVRKAIEYFEAEGGSFALSTGRTPQGMRYYDMSFTNAPSLVANGAMAYDFRTDEIAFLSGIDEGGRDFVRDIHREFPTIAIEMYSTGDITSAINTLDTTHRHFSSQGIEYNTVTNPDDAPLPWIKVMCGGDWNELQRLQVYLAENYTDPTFLPTTGSIVEVLKKGVNKGTGLLRLADSLGIPHNRVFAVGDGYNDVEMLDAAAASFVPMNADDNTKKHATHLVRSNNDGALAHVIEILDSIF